MESYLNRQRSSRVPLIWRFSSSSSSCWSCFSSNSAFFLAFFFIFFFLLFDMLVVLGDWSSFGAVLTAKERSDTELKDGKEQQWDNEIPHILFAFFLSLQQASALDLERNKRNQRLKTRERETKNEYNENKKVSDIMNHSTSQPNEIGTFRLQDDKRIK